MGASKAVTVDRQTAPVIKEFKFNSLKHSQGNYAAVKAKFGPLGSTDAERLARSTKDRRFTLNPLLKGSLSVEEEEKRVLEEKVRAQVEAITEEVREKAKSDGYEDGLKKGFEEAYRKVHSDGAKSLVKFDLLLEELEKAKFEIFKANERFLIGLIYQIARMVTLKEISLDKEYLLRVANELIEEVGVKDYVTIRINPQDAETVEMMKQGLQKSHRELSNLNIEASSQVSPGGCQVTTEWNALDSQVEIQLKRIFESLLGGSTSETP